MKGWMLGMVSRRSLDVSLKHAAGDQGLDDGNSAPTAKRSN
jgi:hypothetical protein